MKLKELEANIYAHLRAKLPHIKRGFLDFRGTNEDYINDRIKEMRICNLIQQFGSEQDVAELYLMGVDVEIPVDVLRVALNEFELEGSVFRE